MKKKLLFLFCLISIIFIGLNNVYADTDKTQYISMGLKDLVADEIAVMKEVEGTEDYIKILEEVDLSKYKESDDKVNVYIFRGNTCGFCLKAVAYFAELSQKMGDKFNIVSYEVWYNADNAQLLEKAAKVFGETVSGVPYIIVGEKTFSGYDSSYNAEIETEINRQYKLKPKKRFDVMVEVNKEPPVYITLLVFIIVSVGLFLLNIITTIVLSCKIKKISKNTAITKDKIVKTIEDKEENKEEKKKQEKKSTSNKTSKKSTKRK